MPLVGYSLHPFHLKHLSVAVVAARPHSMGGPRLSFRRYLTERFGVSSRSQCRAVVVMVVAGMCRSLSSRHPAGG